MKYKVGGKIIATRYGTDHNYEDWYRVTEVKDDRLMLERWSNHESGHFVAYVDLERNKDIKYLAPYSLDEELFTL